MMQGLVDRIAPEAIHGERPSETRPLESSLFGGGPEQEHGELMCGLSDVFGRSRRLLLGVVLSDDSGFVISPPAVRYGCVQRELNSSGKQAEHVAYMAAVLDRGPDLGQWALPQSVSTVGVIDHGRQEFRPLSSGFGQHRTQVGRWNDRRVASTDLKRLMLHPAVAQPLVHP